MQYFQLVDYATRIGSLIAEVIVFAIMPRRGLARQFPVFFCAGGFALFLILRLNFPTDTLNGLVLTLDRSLHLLRCGALLFMWVFASTLGITQNDEPLFANDPRPKRKF